MKHEALIKRLEVSCLGLDAVDPLRLLVDDVVAALREPEQEPVELPCCGYTDASAVKWNPFNGVVQCHNCGQCYTTPPQRTWVWLTDEEHQKIINTHFSAQEALIAAETKSKEKNT